MLISGEMREFSLEGVSFAAIPVGIVSVPRDADLETVREQINRLARKLLNDAIAVANRAGAAGGSAEAASLPLTVRPLSAKWCFLDCKFE